MYETLFILFLMDTDSERKPKKYDEYCSEVELDRLHVKKELQKEKGEECLLRNDRNLDSLHRLYGQNLFPKCLSY